MDVPTPNKIEELKARRQKVSDALDKILISGVASAGVAGRSKTNLEITALNRMLNTLDVQIAKLSGELPEISGFRSDRTEYPL